MRSNEHGMLLAQKGPSLTDGGSTTELLSITVFSGRNSNAASVTPRELLLDTSTMSACSRGKLSRALRLYSSRSRPRIHRIPLTTNLFPNTLLTTNSIARYGPRQTCCFSTTRFQRETTTGNLTDILPVCCPGCGALSQTVEQDEPGYYGASRKQTRRLLASRQQEIEEREAELKVDQLPALRNGVEENLSDDNGEMAVPLPTQGMSCDQVSGTFSFLTLLIQN